MQMAGSEWRSGMFSDLDAGPYPPPPPLSSAYPSRSRTPRGKPWKTRSKRCARRQNRPGGAFTAFTVHVIHLLFSFFFLLPPPHRGKSDSGGAFAVFPSDLIYLCTCVCVRHRRTRFHLSAREEHISGHLITPEERKSKPPRKRKREKEGERSQGEGSAPPLSFSPRCTMGRAVCYPIVWLHFFSHKGGEKEGGVREEERESNRVQADRQLTDVIGTSSRLGGSVRMLGDNLWRIDPLFGSE